MHRVRRKLRGRKYSSTLGMHGDGLPLIAFEPKGRGNVSHREREFAWRATTLPCDLDFGARVRIRTAMPWSAAMI